MISRDVATQLKENVAAAAAASRGAEPAGRAAAEVALATAKMRADTGPRDRLVAWERFTGRIGPSFDAGLVGLFLLRALRNAVAHPVRADVVGCFERASGMRRATLAVLLKRVLAACA